MCRDDVKDVTQSKSVAHLHKQPQITDVNDNGISLSLAKHKYWCIHKTCTVYVDHSNICTFQRMASVASTRFVCKPVLLSRPHARNSPQSGSMTITSFLAYHIFQTSFYFAYKNGYCVYAMLDWTLYLYVRVVWWTLPLGYWGSRITRSCTHIHDLAPGRWLSICYFYYLVLIFQICS